MKQVKKGKGTKNPEDEPVQTRPTEWTCRNQLTASCLETGPPTSLAAADKGTCPRGTYVATLASYVAEWGSGLVPLIALLPPDTGKPDQQLETPFPSHRTTESGRCSRQTFHGHGFPTVPGPVVRGSWLAGSVDGGSSPPSNTKFNISESLAPE